MQQVLGLINVKAPLDAIYPSVGAPPLGRWFIALRVRRSSRRGYRSCAGWADYCVERLNINPHKKGQHKVLAFKGRS
ncbi:MAG: hypothetical protein ABW185_05640 [Sedimenticola sp.]